MKKKSKLGLMTMLVCILLCGCGKDESLETYKANMEKFYELIAQRGNNIDSIDLKSETATKDFLENMDAMEVLFTSLAELEVPKQFSSTEELADDAAKYMKEAVSLYHDAYENEDGYDEFAAEGALENYKRAMKRVKYIADILQGKIPEGEGIVVTTVDDSEATNPPTETTQVSTE